MWQICCHQAEPGIEQVQNETKLIKNNNEKKWLPINWCYYFVLECVKEIRQSSDRSRHATNSLNKIII